MSSAISGIGVVFDIEALGGGFYGSKACRIIMKHLQPSRLIGCTLREGDTRATLSGSAGECCIAIDGGVDVNYIELKLMETPDSDTGSPSAAIVTRQPSAPTSTKRDEPPQEKKWWQFWKEQPKKDTNKCSQCGKHVLSTYEFYDALEAQGFKVDRTTGRANTVVSGAFKGLSALGDYQRKRQELFASIENNRGYQCVACKRIYCTACLMNAPQHSGTGGRACPKCRGNFRHFEAG